MATVLSQIKEAIEGQSEAFEEFKSAYDRRFDELQERVEHVEAQNITRPYSWT
jgi:hypothetical protein